MICPHCNRDSTKAYDPICQTVTEVCECFKNKEFLGYEKPDPDNLQGNPVTCQHCKTHIGYERDFMFLYISPPGYRCPSCRKIAINSI